MDMVTFARTKANRAGSPARTVQPQPTTAQSRQQIGQRARVDVPRSNSNAQRAPLQSGRTRNPQAPNTLSMPPPPRPGHQASSAFKSGGHGDRYDTDVENLDDTTTTVSEVQVLDSQVDSQGRPFRQLGRQESVNGGDEQDDDNETEDGSVDTEDEVRNEGYALDSTVPSHFHHIYAQGLAAMDAQLQPHLSSWMDPSAQSYPTTTDGRLEEDGESDAEAVEQGTLNHAHESRQADLASPQNQQQLPIHSQGHVLQPHPSFQQARSPVRITAYQQKAVISQQTRPQPHLTLRQSEVQVEASASRPQQAVAAPQVDRSVQDNVRQVPAQPVYRNPEPAITGSSAAPTQVEQPAAAQLYQRPEVPQEEQPFDLLDYDPQGLISKPYSDLHNEPFDHDPAQPESVLPETDLNLPLHERLEHVHALPPESQAKFFASLPLSEWEEAGDWFLEQFGGIVQKMKEARKEKRRLAAEFEAEIYKRDRQVASKKRVIDEALDGMKMSGRGVLNTPKKRRG